MKKMGDYDNKHLDQHAMSLKQYTEDVLPDASTL